MINAFSSALSGLRAASRKIQTTANNLANVITPGFKKSDLAVSDVAQGGTQVSGTLRSGGQGSFSTTGSALDLGLDGAGFFIVNNGSGNFYSRAGQFQLNPDGKVQTATGEILQGFQFTGNSFASTLSDVDLAGVQAAPRQTTEFTLGANLDSSAATGTTFNSTLGIVNSAGSQTTLNIEFTKLSSGNSFSFTASLPPGQGVVTGGATGTLAFDSAGQLTSVNGGPVSDHTLTIDFSSANPPAGTQTINFDLADATNSKTNGKLTAFATAFSNNSLVQDGFPTGTLVGIGVDSQGVLSGLFNNGQSQSLFQLGLANFNNPGGLQSLGKNLFAESGRSGQPVIGTAQTGAFGSLVGGALELSNVDIAEEMVGQIIAKNAFIANTRVIKAADEMTGSILDIKA